MFPVLFEIPNVRTMAGEFLVLEIVLGIAAFLVWLALRLKGSESWIGAVASTAAILVVLHAILSQFLENRAGDPVPIPIYSFGVVVILGFLAGTWFIARQTRRIGVDSAKVFDWGFWLLVTGIVGARLLYAFLNWDQFESDKGALFRIWEGGLVWYGGLLPATVVGFLLAARMKLPVLHLVDVCAVALMLALGIGRWACLLAGDDYGLPTDSWLGIRFYHERALVPEGLRGTAEHAAVALHPTQLYMSVNCLWLFWILEWIRRRARFAGQAFAWMLILYAVTRAVLIEPFRGDFVERNPDWGKHVAARVRIEKDAGTPPLSLDRGDAVASDGRPGRLLGDLDLPAGEASGAVWALSDGPAEPLQSGLVAQALAGRGRDDLAPPWPLETIHEGEAADTPAALDLDAPPEGVRVAVDAARWYRSDLPKPPGYVSTSQAISVGVVLAGIAALLFFRRMERPGFRIVAATSS